MEINIDKIRMFFKKDRFATDAGILIESVTEDEVVCVLPVTDAHMNAGDIVQGGVTFTLADFTFGVHANLRSVLGEDDGVTTGQSCTITYLKPPKGRRLTARSRCLSRGRTMRVYGVSITDELGTAVAEMIGNGFNTPGGRPHGRA